MKLEVDVTFNLSPSLIGILNSLLAAMASGQWAQAVPAELPSAPVEAKPAAEKKAKKAKAEPVAEPVVAPSEPVAPAPAAATPPPAAPTPPPAPAPAASSSVTVATLAPMVTETVKKLGVAPVRTLLEKYKAKQLVDLGANIDAFSADLAELRKTSGLL